MLFLILTNSTMIFFGSAKPQSNVHNEGGSRRFMASSGLSAMPPR
jgi:hypothetical protein